MDTPLDHPTTDERPHHDATLRTCRPALTGPDPGLPDDLDTTDPERNIVRGDD